MVKDVCLIAERAALEELKSWYELLVFTLELAHVD